MNTQATALPVNLTPVLPAAIERASKKLAKAVKVANGAYRECFESLNPYMPKGWWNGDPKTNGNTETENAFVKAVRLKIETDLIAEGLGDKIKSTWQQIRAFHPDAIAAAEKRAKEKAARVPVSSEKDNPLANVENLAALGPAIVGNTARIIAQGNPAHAAGLTAELIQGIKVLADGSMIGAHKSHYNQAIKAMQDAHESLMWVTQDVDAREVAAEAAKADKAAKAATGKTRTRNANK